MGEVTSLAEARKKREEQEQEAQQETTPHAAGEFVCVGCKYEWIGIAPIPAAWVDCPSCELPKGTPRYPYGANDGEAMLVCSSCDGYALTAFIRNNKRKVICMGCGVDLSDVF